MMVCIKIVKAKDIHNKPIVFMEHKQSDLACWLDILKNKKLHMCGKIRIGVGVHTGFSDDVWYTSEPLKGVFPELFVVCENPTGSFSQCLGYKMVI